MRGSGPRARLRSIGVRSATDRTGARRRAACALRVALVALAALVALPAAGAAAHRSSHHAARRAPPPPPPPSSIPKPSDPRLAALPPIVGQFSSEMIEDPQDTILDVAHRNRLGFERIVRLNPGVNVWIPDPGTVVQLPTEHVLPVPPWRGLVINIPEMQLYDFTVDPVEVFAIAIGDEMDPSLIGNYKIGRKREQPAWYVPKSIQAERPDLPAVVPAGPDNPLGPFWMTIGNTSYGIHGSNNEWSIGRQATHGCIRLYNDKIEELYRRTPTGTPLRLDYQTVKLGQRGSTLYVESHPDVYNRDPDRVETTLARLASLDLLRFVDPALVRRVIAEEKGIPVAVATLPPLGEPSAEQADGAQPGAE